MLRLEAQIGTFFRKISDGETGVSTAAAPNLRPGRVYRAHDFARWSANPTRLAKRLVRQGVLVQLAHGLFARPKQSGFGPVPPDDEALMRVFLGTSRFLFTPPGFWNLLRLGATA